ncbi:hypothetical protein [Romboutsia sp.]|uniref:hypothetical protein n=1 Tax=Romboutsia sp. TaxID=1965302 RepID=UPI003F3DB657
MVYKSIEWLIKKEDLKNNSILYKSFSLEEENKTIIHGIAVYVDNYTPAKNALVSLQESKSNEEQYVDKYLTFTDEKGYFLISFTPEEYKKYKIVVYYPSTNS